ncbi:hypothetical protein F2P56_004131 [Juglans regia]|uniref:RING-type E3 ubiquitin transferase n=2 Tax=Juglans regia TaxID=51240 RepID=A0A833Y8T9_JUGRE|nr:probable E3 ubiquitin-protein ligase BAH1-like 1 [Juglans regia]KAF5477495.1 hypothetical protein F2P56_004131 [Juglans regia]
MHPFSLENLSSHRASSCSTTSPSLLVESITGWRIFDLGIRTPFQTCRAWNDIRVMGAAIAGYSNTSIGTAVDYAAIQVFDHKFFSKLTKEASEINGCFSSRVRHLLDLHVASGMQGYLFHLRHCFKNDQQAMVLEGWILGEYVTMNAITIKKILKKYDKVHCSENGRNFKSRLREEHIELLQSLLLIELATFYLSFNGKKGEFNEFSCDFDATRPVMTLRLLHSIKLEYDLTCVVCRDVVFNSYAMSCSHFFCKSCACL